MMATTAFAPGRLILGCGNFGGIGSAPNLIGKGLDEAASFETMDEAVTLGITLFDTAERYAGGASEEMRGRWLAAQDEATRDSVRNSTKVAPPTTDGLDRRFDESFLRERFERSRQRLGVDSVELLMTHAPDGHTPIEDTLEGLEAIRSDGLCAHIGACNLDPAQLTAALDAADRLGVTGYEVVQNGYSLLQPDGEAEVRSICAERGMAFTSYSSMAGGILTGKYRRDQEPPENTRMALRPEGFLTLLTPEVYDALDRLRDAAVGKGVSSGALALAWLIHSPTVTAPIFGPSRPKPHLTPAAEAIGIDLTPDEHDQVASWFREASDR
jgi:aryl-alcohol dehydrogenase-like predicted oxidoreductase